MDNYFLFLVCFGFLSICLVFFLLSRIYFLSFFLLLGFYVLLFKLGFLIYIVGIS